MHLTVYGIRNCDTCRAIQKWLKNRDVPFTFHDIRADGLDEGRLRSWLESVHGPNLVNKRSATWRKLDDDSKAAALADPAPVLMEHPTLIKRPVVTDDEEVLDVGFVPDRLEKIIRA